MRCVSRNCASAGRRRRRYGPASWSGRTPHPRLTTRPAPAICPAGWPRNPHPFDISVTTSRFLPPVAKYFFGSAPPAALLQTLPRNGLSRLDQSTGACQHERPLRRVTCNVHARSRRHLLRKILVPAVNVGGADCARVWDVPRVVFGSIAARSSGNLLDERSGGWSQTVYGDSAVATRRLSRRSARAGHRCAHYCLRERHFIVARGSARTTWSGLQGS